jgi:hypothetical protein
MAILPRLSALALITLQTVPCSFAEEAAPTLTMGSDFRLSPSSLIVPANSSFRLVLRNDSTEGERFGSDDLNIEQGVAPGQSLEITLGPLKAGEYGFFGFLHRNTAKAEILAR